MKIKKNVATSDEGFVFNPSTGDSFSTNEIGVLILSLLKSGKDESEIMDDVCEKYDITRDLLEKDLNDYFAQLKDFAIIEE